MRRGIAVGLIGVAMAMIPATVAQAGQTGHFTASGWPVYKNDPHLWGGTNGDPIVEYTNTSYSVCILADDFGWLQVHDLHTGKVGWTLQAQYNNPSYSCS
jgi:hypothetical protein